MKAKLLPDFISFASNFSIESIIKNLSGLLFELQKNRLMQNMIIWGRNFRIISIVNPKPYWLFTHGFLIYCMI